MKTKILLFFLILFNSVFCLENISVMNVTLSDSSTGLLHGIYQASVRLYDRDSNIEYWSAKQSIYFENGFAEIFIGPVDIDDNVERPYVELNH